MPSHRRSGPAPSRPRDVRAAIELGLATMLGPVGGFVANIVFARTLGASGRGDLAAIVAALAVCEAILAVALSDILARHIAKGDIPVGAQRTLVTGAVVVSLIPGVLVAIYCHIWHFSWPVAVAAGLVVPLTTGTVIGRGVLLGRHAYRKLTLSQIVGGVIRLLAPLTLLLVEHPTENLGLVVVLSWSVATAIPILASRPFAENAAAIRDVWPILRASLIIWPVHMAWLLHVYLDQLVLAAFVSPADLGLYAVCVGIAQAPAALASGPRQVLLARAAKSQNLDEIPKVAQAVLAIAVVSGAISAYFAGPLLAAVFGPEFGGTSLVLGLLLAATGFDIALGLFNTGLVAVGRLRSAAINQSVGLLVTVVVLPIAVASGGGILSAAIIRLVSSAAACFSARIDVLRFCRSQPIKSEQL
ncbi:membrane protein involved in the export of O-antigen and teichoic acid [Mycobacterium sp. JS623]|uniref:lipopolysaccharide biosynthesis protein n=1 Tax=Mycobacterium sp. JS623 TaxID=212767 RepID=UPI0002A56995|nr:oligosaccharide flippase family protein [Mycobacterium sp. JS623]AGB21353.1 membrane protein involved in the export of O-antigen and teichoic acid [Mycobacterium sp. JS623]